MNEEFVPYEIALELKKLGFNIPCISKYEEKPLYQQAFRWIRGAYNISYKFEPSINDTVSIYTWQIVGWKFICECKQDDAELLCLKEMIKIIKDDIRIKTM